jgi:hypothetical protein
MESDRSIAEEGTKSWEGGCVEIGIGLLEGAIRDLSVLSREITNLAGLGSLRIARDELDCC